MFFEKLKINFYFKKKNQTRNDYLHKNFKIYIFT